VGSGSAEVGMCIHEQAEASEDQSWSSQALTAAAGQACIVVYGATQQYMHQVELWRCWTGLTGRPTELLCFLYQLTVVGAEMLYTS